jgi:hypothetical protein
MPQKQEATDYDRYLFSSIGLIRTDVASDWPAMVKWTDSKYIVETVPNKAHVRS